ncbi:hypothetical protein LF1_42050 [Rubripirellula obstinata]|uniref:Endonuclease/Exonuclease/phosphatase family protein n=1 Tax=Rubripirellula obstinata TaxID=406547 RepID=A0A5B1CPT7_9BACT|nr:hypothetical protein [Rubripirellula obstinata]KAA1261650.1 hypothetical protein LF1_42050 [Rubripirellula obstinata]
MSESGGGSPIQVLLIVALLAGGGYYYVNHYQDGGLKGLSFASSSDDGDNDFYDESFVSYRDAPVMIGPSQSVVANTNLGQVPPLGSTIADSARTTGTFSAATSFGVGNPSTTVRPTLARSVAQSPHRPAYRPIKIASWALDGFGPTKLASADARKYVSKIVRRYDIIALQQIASIERDLIPRLVDVVNGTEHRYDYVMGSATGPRGRQEQLAFLFDTTKVLVDRSQTYTVTDPAEELTYDPMVASFRAAEPPSAESWTFSIVNVRIDLAEAASEVALLPSVITSIRRDGRGEDDVIIMGLLQADDAYLLPTVGANQFHAAVRHRSTDVFSRFQTSNILIERESTSEYLGRGGVFDFCRNYDLNPIEAEAVTSHLPVFAEFTAHEGGEL